VCFFLQKSNLASKFLPLKFFRYKNSLLTKKQVSKYRKGGKVKNRRLGIKFCGERGLSSHFSKNA